MADYLYNQHNGVIIPDTSATRAQVEAESKDVFGQDLDVAPSTPQGMLITRIVLERDAVARNNAAVANQLHPDIASGVFLDGLFGFLGGKRRPATRSRIFDVELGGTPGALIPDGSV